MSTIMIDIPPETYERLEEQARRAGKAPVVLAREILETALQAHEVARLSTTREILQASGRVRPLSETLRRKIIPGVTLDEVRMALTSVTGPSLSDLIMEQRGQKL